MYCQKCAAEIADGSQFCSVCGTPTGTPPGPTPYPYPYPYSYQPPVKQTNNMALLGLILAFVMPLAGMIISLIARKQCQERGEDGAHLAKAGIIVGAIYSGLVFVILIAALTIPFVMLAPMFNEIVEAIPGMM